MSSRTGQNILYTDVRDEVFAYTEEQVRSRHAEWSDEKIAATVKAVGVCALKFEMIFRDHNRPIVYEVARVCDFEGDTGPYIQYTHARCNSILAKLGKKPMQSARRLQPPRDRARVRARERTPQVPQQSSTKSPRTSTRANSLSTAWSSQKR